MSDTTASSHLSIWWPSALRVLLFLVAGLLAWVIAERWNSWVGAARYLETDDAYVTGDLTPLASKVSGYVLQMNLSDYQTVRRGDLLAEIDPSDYQAALDEAEANAGAAASVLANLANQKAIQQALILQAAATIKAVAADSRRYSLEAQRQRALLQTHVAGALSQIPGVVEFSLRKWFGLADQGVELLCRTSRMSSFCLT
jgi:membrane fusion protein (multidrug efflux system)